MPSRSNNHITQNFTQISILQNDYLHYEVAFIHEKCIIFSHTSTLQNTGHHECTGKAPPDHNAVPGGVLNSQGWVRCAETYNARQPFFICSCRNLKHDVFRSVACLLKLPIILVSVVSQNCRKYLSVWYQKMHHETYLKLFRLYVNFFQVTGEPSSRWPEMNRFQS